MSLETLKAAIAPTLEGICPVSGQEKVWAIIRTSYEAGEHDALDAAYTRVREECQYAGTVHHKSGKFCSECGLWASAVLDTDS